MNMSAVVLRQRMTTNPRRRRGAPTVQQANQPTTPQRRCSRSWRPWQPLVPAPVSIIRRPIRSRPDSCARAPVGVQHSSRRARPPAPRRTRPKRTGGESSKAGWKVSSASQNSSCGMPHVQDTTTAQRQEGPDLVKQLCASNLHESPLSEASLRSKGVTRDELNGQPQETRCTSTRRAPLTPEAPATRTARAAFVQAIMAADRATTRRGFVRCKLCHAECWAPNGTIIRGICAVWHYSAVRGSARR
jgi:hypothetical protein